MKYFATLPFITNEVSNKAMLAVATPHGAQASHVRPYEQLASSTNWNPTLFFYFPWQERRTQNCPLLCSLLLANLAALTVFDIRRRGGNNETHSLLDDLKGAIRYILALAINIDGRRGVAVNRHLFAAAEMGDIPAQMHTFFILRQERQQLESTIFLLHYNKIEHAVIRHCERGRFIAAAIPAGVRAHAKQQRHLFWLTAVDGNGKLIIKLTENAINRRSRISHIALHKREFLEGCLLCANLGINAHGALVDGNLIAALDAIQLKGGAIDLCVNIQKLLLCAKKPDKIIPRSKGQHRYFRIGVAKCAVDRLK